MEKIYLSKVVTTDGVSTVTFADFTAITVSLADMPTITLNYFASVGLAQNVRSALVGDTVDAQKAALSAKVEQYKAGILRTRTAGGVETISQQDLIVHEFLSILSTQLNKPVMPISDVVAKMAVRGVVGAKTFVKSCKAKKPAVWALAATTVRAAILMEKQNDLLANAEVQTEGEIEL